MITKNTDFAWIIIGIPAVLAWLAYGLCWLLEPRLAVEVSPIVWAEYAAGGWYAILIAFWTLTSVPWFLW